MFHRFTDQITAVGMIRLQESKQTLTMSRSMSGHILLYEYDTYSSISHEYIDYICITTIS